MSSKKTNEHDLSKDVEIKSCRQDLEDDELRNLATSAGETSEKMKSG